MAMIDRCDRCGQWTEVKYLKYKGKYSDGEFEGFFCEYCRGIIESRKDHRQISRKMPGR
jgi:hypothetical protein